MVVAKEYLETSQSEGQWRDRFWQLTQDTVSLNMACGMGEDIGSFAAAPAANKMDDRYVDEIVETSFTLRNSEKLNQRIYEEFAKKMGTDLSTVSETGIARQFVPQASRGNILDRPTRGSRPLWAYKYVKPGKGPFNPGRGPLAFISPLIFNKRSAL